MYKRFLREAHISTEQTALNLPWGAKLKVASSSETIPRTSGLFFLPANGRSLLTLYSAGDLVQDTLLFSRHNRFVDEDMQMTDTICTASFQGEEEGINHC